MNWKRIILQIKKTCDISKVVCEFHRIGEKVNTIEKKIFNAAESSFKNESNNKHSWELRAAWNIFRELSKSKIYEIYLKANYYLGCCYENGIGRNKNEQLALHHFEMAANAGSIEAKNK
ncbi:37476_t:CDS:1, partial [Gigaspora margarita]